MSVSLRRKPNSQAVKRKREGTYSDLGELGGDTGRNLANSQAGEFLSKTGESGGQISDASLSELGRLVLLWVHLAL